MGAFTEPEVMLTMRPKRRATMPSITPRISATGASMLASSPAIMSAWESSRKSFGGGPPLLLTRMSGSGHAAMSAARPSGVPTSAATGVAGALVASWIARAAASTAAASRPLTITSQPACASAIAQARPRPLLEAQTIARLPLRPRFMLPFPSRPAPEARVRARRPPSPLGRAVASPADPQHDLAARAAAF